MTGTNTVVVVRIDQGGPVHISEVISQVLPRYGPPLWNDGIDDSGSRAGAFPEGRAIGQLMRFPLGAFWVTTTH